MRFRVAEELRPSCWFSEYLRARNLCHLSGSRLLWAIVQHKRRVVRRFGKQYESVAENSECAALAAGIRVAAADAVDGKSRPGPSDDRHGGPLRAHLRPESTRRVRRAGCAGAEGRAVVPGLSAGGGRVARSGRLSFPAHLFLSGRAI